MKNGRLFVLAASFFLTAFMLARSGTSTVYADCSGTGVDTSGATCGTSGSSPGRPGDGADGGQPGEPGDSNNDSNPDNNSSSAVVCTPGTVVNLGVNFPASSSGISIPGQTLPPSPDVSFTLPEGGVVGFDGLPSDMCVTGSIPVDSCTGEVMGAPSFSSLDGNSWNFTVSECPTSYVIPDHPCDEFMVSDGGVTCISDLAGQGSGGSSWELRVHVGWPGIEIHTRPFPATLVDWDTVMRVAGLGSSSGSGRLAYAAWGGGSGGASAAGDWRDVVLRLEIKPLTDWADVYLQNIGLSRMPVGRLHTLQWNLPSHPAAGGIPLAGQVGQLEELPPDTPLYSNWTRAPYMVYCTLEYYEWESSCESGPDESGATNCRRDSNGNFTSHREWGWKRHSQTIPIPPTAARVDLPASFLADLNGDGVPDAYWGHTTFVRRMDDAGRIDNPEWAHWYSWPGPYWYWAVREAQGQVGWPGVWPK